MRPMKLRPIRKAPFLAVMAASLVASLAAPSCGGGAGDQTAKFVGTWTFSSGELQPTCALITTPFSLAGLTVMFAKVDDSTISLGIGMACTVNFKVSGDKATVEPMQTCTLDIAELGPVAVAINAWALTLSGDSIDNTIAGSVAVCTASGTAVLVRGAGDGGANHDDAATGGHGGGGSSGGGGGGAGGSGAATGAGGTQDAGGVGHRRRTRRARDRRATPASTARARR